MEWLNALTDEQMNDDQTKAFERALSKLGIEESADAPAWLRVLANSPEFLKDTYMNLDKAVFADGKLQAKTKFVIAAVAAAHAGSRDLATFFAERAIEGGFTQEQVYESLGLGATTTSFNHYYKFRSLSSMNEFDGFNPGLRATLFMRPSLGMGFAEIINLVISSANGCSSCVTGHVQKAEQNDVTKEQIDEATRVGAIVQAMAMFLRTSSAVG